MFSFPSFPRILVFVVSPRSWFLRFSAILVPWFLGCSVSRFLGFLVSWFLGVFVWGFLRFVVSLFVMFSVPSFLHIFCILVLSYLGLRALFFKCISVSSMGSWSLCVLIFWLPCSSACLFLRFLVSSVFRFFFSTMVLGWLHVVFCIWHSLALLRKLKHSRLRKLKYATPPQCGLWHSAKPWTRAFENREWIGDCLQPENGLVTVSNLGEITPVISVEPIRPPTRNRYRAASRCFPRGISPKGWEYYLPVMSL